MQETYSIYIERMIGDLVGSGICISDSLEAITNYITEMTGDDTFKENLVLHESIMSLTYFAESCEKTIEELIREKKLNKEEFLVNMTTVVLKLKESEREKYYNEIRYIINGKFILTGDKIEQIVLAIDPYLPVVHYRIITTLKEFNNDKQYGFELNALYHLYTQKYISQQVFFNNLAEMIPYKNVSIYKIRKFMEKLLGNYSEEKELELLKKIVLILKY